MSKPDPQFPAATKRTALPEEAFAGFLKSLQSGADFLETLYENVKKSDNGQWDGIAYAYTKDNLLPPDWIQQTPNVWGKPANAVPLGAGSFVAKNVQKLIRSANQFIDITSLYPYPDGEFETAIINGLVDLAKEGRDVTVRILTGFTPLDVFGSQRKYLESLIAQLKPIKTGNLKIYVAAQQTEYKDCWNHAKIVAVDGQMALVGGENLWADDYLGASPVHDMNILLQGSIVYYMHKFTDVTWSNVCGYTHDNWKPVYWHTGATEIVHACLDKSQVKLQPGPGTLPVLGAGRYGTVLDPAVNPADVAMLLCFSAAKETIYIAQQDLLNYLLVWEAGLTEIAKALIREVDVYIVISNDYAKAGNGSSYSTSTVRHTAFRIKEYVSAQPNAPSGNKLTELLCSKLHLSTLRFGPSDTWPNGYEFANHSKFFMVDDKVFYVGSENLYPADLVEYGVFISDAKAINEIKTHYWENLWKYSERVAISGKGVAKCVFQ